jgi:hypothetical protein
VRALKKQTNDTIGYGNIYTPHAGSMVIQVQRESGLANRTYVLSPRQVALLRFLLSKRGIAIIVALASSWLLFAFLAFRVPVLTQRINELQHENKQLDSLTVALSKLHGRYDQIRRLLSATATPTASAPAPATVTPSPAARAAAGPAAADSTTHAPDSTTTPRKP